MMTKPPKTAAIEIRDIPAGETSMKRKVDIELSTFSTSEIWEHYFAKGAKMISEGSFGCVLLGSDKKKVLKIVLWSARRGLLEAQKEEVDLLYSLNQLSAFNPFFVQFYGLIRFVDSATVAGFLREHQDAIGCKKFTHNLQRFNKDLQTGDRFIAAIEVERMHGDIGSMLKRCAFERWSTERLHLFLFILLWQMETLHRYLKTIHKDVKPANILYRESDREVKYRIRLHDTYRKPFTIVVPKGFPIPVLSDFGLSETLTQRSRHSNSWSTWQVGTLNYNPPYRILFANPNGRGSRIHFVPFRLFEDDYFSTGLVFLTVLLNGWKFGKRKMNLPNVASVFILWRKKIPSMDLALTSVEQGFLFEIHRNKGYRPLLSGKRMSDKDYETKVLSLIDVALALCCFQHYLGNGFLPSESSKYAFGPLGLKIRKLKNLVLDLGKSFGNKGSNFFEQAVRYIEDKHGLSTRRLVQNLMSWMPEERNSYLRDVIIEKAYRGQINVFRHLDFYSRFLKESIYPHLVFMPSR